MQNILKLILAINIVNTGSKANLKQILDKFYFHVTVHRRHSEGKEPTRCDKVVGSLPSLNIRHLNGGILLKNNKHHVKDWFMILEPRIQKIMFTAAPLRVVYCATLEGNKITSV
jgi:hypothetical protein